MVAWGANRAILCTSWGFSSRPSIFTMSLTLNLLLGTLIAMVIMRFSFPVMPKILTTSSACPPVMWSITVPSLIFETYSIVSLIGFPFTGYTPQRDKRFLFPSKCAETAYLRLSFG